MQPIVLLGGFLSSPQFYSDLRRGLTRLTGQRVWIARVQTYHWPMVISSLGWARVLDKLDLTVRQAVRESASGRVTLVGHSAGGVLARLYLAPQPFLGRTFAGVRQVDQLITLGSPHHNQGGWRRGGPLSRWVQERYPDAYFAPQVHYTCVAGRWLCGERSGSSLQRWAYDFYKDISGNGNEWGDGVTPVESALLSGADRVLLDGVSHFSMLGTPWYGSKETIHLWWPKKGGDDALESQNDKVSVRRSTGDEAP